MPYRDNSKAIDVFCVDYEQIEEFWPIAEPFIVTGLKAARTDTLGCILARLYSSENHLWLITADGVPCGAFVTAFKQDRHSRGFFLAVSNLGGTGIGLWARKLAEAVVKFSQDNECDGVRFYGRGAWARVLPEYKIIGQHETGHMLFERAF